MKKFWRKETVVLDLFTQTIPIAPNDVIVIKGEFFMEMEDEQMDDFMEKVHAQFPTNLVVVMDRGDTFETQSIYSLRAMLEDLIAHQEAVEREAG